MFPGLGSARAGRRYFARRAAPHLAEADFDRVAGAGHAFSKPGILAQLLAATNRMGR